jgi:hypothetical protein
MPIGRWHDSMKRLTGKILPLEDRRRDQTRAILHRFAEAGIPVLVVTPPANESSEAYYARISREARSTVGPVAARSAVFFLEPSRLWPDEQFTDPVHMDPNQTGSYRAWLSAAILAALGD